jgi:hypothetical protein
MLYTHILGQFFFQALDFRAHDILAVIQNTSDIGFNLFPNALLLSRQVDKLHLAPFPLKKNQLNGD